MDISKRSFNPLSRIVSFTARAFGEKNAFPMMLVSFLFGIYSFGSGINPFSLALLLCTDKLLFPIFLGTFFSCAFAGKSVAVNLLICLIVILVKGLLHRSHKRLSALFTSLLSVAAAAALAAGSYLASSRTFLELSQSCAYSTVLPLFTFLFMGLFSVKPPLGAAHRRVAQIAVCFTFACVFSAVRYGVFSLSAVWSVALILFCSKKAALARPSVSMLLGCVCGFVCALGCGDMSYFPAFGLCGLSAGFLFVYTKNYAVFFSLAVTVLFSAAADPEMLLPALVSCAAALPVYAAFGKLPEGLLALFALAGSDEEKALEETAAATTLAHNSKNHSPRSRAHSFRRRVPALHAPKSC
ncbi:MAG TPA: hypothetical protein PLT66_00710 [Bacillota bacterium]|nr:hypothetical protein [Bacillota bacterium]